MFRDSEKVLNRLGVETDVHARVGELSPANRQRVEMAKALSKNANVLIMDEPTASLTLHDVKALFSIVAQLREHRVGIS